MNDITKALISRDQVIKLIDDHLKTVRNSADINAREIANLFCKDPKDKNLEMYKSFFESARATERALTELRGKICSLEVFYPGQ